MYFSTPIDERASTFSTKFAQNFGQKRRKERVLSSDKQTSSSTSNFAERWLETKRNETKRNAKTLRLKLCIFKVTLFREEQSHRRRSSFDRPLPSTNFIQSLPPKRPCIWRNDTANFGPSPSEIRLTLIRLHGNDRQRASECLQDEFACRRKSWRVDRELGVH